MNLVVDASAAVEYLLRTPVGEQVGETLRGAHLLAPELLDAEVLAVLRREVLAGRVAAERAKEALDDLSIWGIHRVSHVPLLDRAWTFRHNASGYDALYLAVASVEDASIVTTDGPLSALRSAASPS